MCKKDDILLPSNLVLKYMCAKRSADVMLLMSCYAHNSSSRKRSLGDNSYSSNPYTRNTNNRNNSYTYD